MWATLGTRTSAEVRTATVRRLHPGVGGVDDHRHTRGTNEDGEGESRSWAVRSAHYQSTVASIPEAWFGIPAGDNNVEPIRGEDADTIAKRLGFPPLAPGEPGTTIAVVSPKLDGHAEDGPSVSRGLVSGTCGPRWSPSATSPAMTFNVARDGDGLELADPRRRCVAFPVPRTLRI